MDETSDLLPSVRKEKNSQVPKRLTKTVVWEVKNCRFWAGIKTLGIHKKQPLFVDQIKTAARGEI